MSYRAQVRLENGDVVLYLEQQEQASWNDNIHTVVRSAGGTKRERVGIDQGVVNQMLEEAYAAGLRKGEGNLAQVRAILNK